MDQTKITVRLHPGLAAKFDSQLKSCFIKRDAFLNQVIKNEAPLLKAELAGKQLSPQAHRYIARQLKRAGAKPVNLLLDKAVVASLKEAVEGSNVVRDAYVNFLLLCLRSSAGFLNHFELPTRHTGSGFKSHMEPIAVSPLDAISEAMWDPFYYLREAVRERYGVGLYELSLPTEFHSCSVYLADEEVPGTQAHQEQIRLGEELLEQFDTLEATAFSQTKKEPS